MCSDLKGRKSQRAGGKRLGTGPRLEHNNYLELDLNSACQVVFDTPKCFH